VPVGSKDEFDLLGGSVVEGQRNVSDSDGTRSVCQRPPPSESD